MRPEHAHTPSAPAPRALGAYAIGDELGRGAMSVVYRATRDGRDYAVKIMAGRTDAVEAQLIFRREAAAVARLDHPGLVRVLEVGESEGRPYLVMDLAEGEGLDRRIARRPLDDAQAVAVATSLADALAEVHRFGLVHRDIKPGNIVLAPSGEARLIDFGLVSGETDAETVVGTLHYAAPEQLGMINRPVGPPSDLYALGVTLFEALTGRPPLHAADATTFLHALATTPAPDLRDVRPGTRPALAAIIARLLKKDPDDRYQSARGLLADLAALGRFDEVLRAGGQITLGAQDRRASAESELPLVGRERELTQLGRALDAAQRGAFTVVTLEGEGGSGKSRLAREVVSRAEASGALILSGKCHELETVPFGPLREAADQLAAHVQRLPEGQRALETERVREAAGEWSALVRRLSVGLARLIGPTPDIRALEPDAEQQRFYQAIAGFFRQLATPRRPVVMVLDDVQWLDEGSLRVLRHLGGDDGDAPLLLVATSRNGAEHQAALQRFVQASRGHLASRLELAPLDLDATTALITATLGGRPLDRALVQRLAALTHGNPFALGQYLRTLLEHGILRPAGGHWFADEAALEAVQLPRDVIELVVRRLYALGAEASRVAGVAAILGGRFGLDLLAGVSAVTPALLGRTLDELVGAGLVERTHADDYAFVHDRVREAALDRLDDASRRDLHQRAAEALDARKDLSATERFALARHYAAGHPERNPARAAEVNLDAGLRALEDHANEEAFELFDRALGLYRAAALPLPMRLLEGLGRACAMTGRLERAFEHLEEALGLARDKHDRFRLQHLLTLTYASQGRNGEALDAVFKTFSVLGRSFPKSRVLQVFSLLGYWLCALFMRWTGLRAGRATGEERERRRVLSQLHYTGSMVSLFQGDPILMVQFVVRDFYNVHFLGPTPETAVASSLYGAVMGMFKLKGVMRRHTGAGVQIAEQLGDRAALAVAHAYEAMGAKWSGDLVRGNALLAPALSELHRYVPGSWYAAMMIAEQAYSYLHAGHTLDAIDHCKQNLGQLERTNNLMYRWNTLSVLYAETMLTGDSGPAAELLSALEPAYAPLQNTLYVKLAKVIADLEVMTDQEEVGPRVEETLALFRSLASEDYYSNAGRMLAGYARLHQFEKAAPEDKRRARKLLVRAIWALRLRAMVPVFQCHPLIWRAALARTDKRFERARRLLARAERLARECDSHRGRFQVALERARLARDQRDPVASYYAEAAIEVAESQRWRRRARRVRSEFSLAPARPETLTNLTRVAATATPRSVEQSHRYAQALLQVSLASASTLDVASLAKNALLEVSRVLGAERALFFIVGADGELSLIATHGPDTAAISQSVVRRVVDTRSPLVLTGTEEGEALGSESMVTHGLRSILAAPVLLRDQLLGVVYLDSRLAKGIFTPEDVVLLHGVSNHIAIALETARAARHEAERLAMQRDLELVGAVQNLIMPKSAQIALPGLRGAGFYQPASQCGGDWWWYDALPDGTLLLLLGDVSGHGAASAMITAAVAGAFQTLRRQLGVSSPTALMAELDRLLRAFGDYTMTMAVVHVDPYKGELTLHNAGSPGLLAWQGGRCHSVVSPGRVLGDDGPLQLGVSVLQFRPGDRILLSTDGLLELKDAHGRQLGPRRVARLFEGLAQVPIDEVPGRLQDEVRSTLLGRAQQDDITCVVIESTDGGAHTAAATPVAKESP